MKSIRYEDIKEGYEKDKFIGLVNLLSKVKIILVIITILIALVLIIYDCIPTTYEEIHEKLIFDERVEVNEH